jgi:transcriptional regulator of acetoin/glycerol metabolism
MTHGQHLPANPFYASAAQRIALARQRYFEEGIRPSGMVSEAVIQSWTRCLHARRDPSHPVEFEPVTHSRMHSALRLNQQLLAAAADEMARLQYTLAGTSSTAMLTDAQGIIIGSTFVQARSHERLMPVTTRIGVNLSEEAVGTTAPGVTARTARPCVVSGSEHYFGNVQTMHCAAAPIHDIRGQLAGVLDLSSEGLPFGFDAGSVVGHYAAEIENRLLCAQSTEHLVVRMQIAPNLLDTPMAGLAGVTGDGRLDWCNAAAARLLGLGLQRRGGVEEHFGVPLSTLIGWSTPAQPQPLHLPSGLMLWIRCDWRSRDGHHALHAAAATTRPGHAPPAPPDGRPQGAASLREAEHQAILRALAEHGGNVSKAARALGVSRGRVYRHLRADAAPARQR